jgi:histone deacetylase complex subunit SAP18
MLRNHHHDSNRERSREREYKKKFYELDFQHLNKEFSKEVNRKKICPFLIRVFYNFFDYNRINAFDNDITELNELHIYTWMDSNLKELTELILGALDRHINKKKPSLTFSLIYRDSKGKIQRREIGEIAVNKENIHENKTLKMANFKIGDFLDVKINI